MRYMELPAPLDGWTHDESGTLYSPTGYRCSARTLECALWLFQCYSLDATRWLIRSDERPGQTRPLYKTEDAKSGFAENDCRGNKIDLDRDQDTAPPADRSRDQTSPMKPVQRLQRATS